MAKGVHLAKPIANAKQNKHVILVSLDTHSIKHLRNAYNAPFQSAALMLAVPNVVTRFRELHSYALNVQI